MAAGNNLSETLFKPSVKHRETSTLVARVHHGGQKSILSALDGANPGNCYRLINRLMWIWRGINPWEIEEVLARIAASRAPHTDDWLQAARFYSIASYPHLKGDMLAEQAQTLANHAWEEAAKHLPHEIKQLDFPVSGGGNVTGLPVSCICRRREERLIQRCWCAVVWICCKTIPIGCFTTTSRPPVWRC